LKLLQLPTGQIKMQHETQVYQGRAVCLLQLPTGQIKMQLYIVVNDKYLIELQLPTGQIKMQHKSRKEVKHEQVATPHGSDKNAT